MAMDFFQHQERAHKETRKLLAYYAVAVVFVVTAVYILMTFVVGGMEGVGPLAPLLEGESAYHTPHSRVTGWMGDDLPGFDPELFLCTTVGTAILIFIGSSIVLAQLSSGGQAVATLLGGRPVSPQTIDLKERQLLNVVEEMAIASGTPVPAVYLLDQEKGINAFSAGYALGDAVVGVTRGTIDALTRDELQGVVAHEFSHILNGDMRLNMRLACLAGGIQFVALMGRLVFELPLRAVGIGDSRKKGGGGVVLVIILLGCALMVIGSIGVLAARLIQAAISRQREFLADASAVQFTRNPEGIGGALKKIGGWKAGSRLRAPRVAEAGHFLFANGMGLAWFPGFATHPSITERVLRIDPAFDGKLVEADPAEEEGADAAALHDTNLDEALGFAPAHQVREPVEFLRQAPGLAAALPVLGVAAVAAQGMAGSPGPDVGAQVIGSLPDVVRTALREPFAAQAAVLAMVLSPDPGHREEQLDQTGIGKVPGLKDETVKLRAAMEDIDRHQRMAVLDLALPALRHLSREQYGAFKAMLKAVIQSDSEIDLFEYCLERRLVRHLESSFDPKRTRLPAFQSLLPVLPDCQVVLSALAHLSGQEAETAEDHFKDSLRQLNVETSNLTLLPIEHCGIDDIDRALDRLAGLTPVLKKNVLYACGHAVMADGELTHDEAELIRALADGLDCSLPPNLNPDGAGK
jgi:Zn-dependent protease with chaperone function